jgi:hypothetical protein
VRAVDAAGGGITSLSERAGSHRNDCIAAKSVRAPAHFLRPVETRAWLGSPGRPGPAQRSSKEEASMANQNQGGQQDRDQGGNRGGQGEKSGGQSRNDNDNRGKQAGSRDDDNDNNDNRGGNRGGNQGGGDKR